MPGTIAGKPVSRLGFGMISLMHPGRVSTSDAIEILKAALDMGSNLWNAGDYYGTPEYNSLHLLKAYFTKYPEDADNVIVCVKSCIDVQNAIPHTDAASVSANIEKCPAILDGKCRIDVFQLGRLDREVPIEETIGAIDEYVKAGKIGSVGLSECSGATIRKAVTVAPISAVDVELSLFETGIFENGVSDACKEFGIPNIAYSPFSRGFLTGEYRKYEDMSENDNRKIFPRYAPENFANSVQLVDLAEQVAEKKGCSISQVALAWIIAQTNMIEVPVVPIPGTMSKTRLKENTTEFTLTADELREINHALMKIEVKGERYMEKHARLLSV